MIRRVLILTAVAALVLAGCNRTGEGGQGSSAEAAATETPEQFIGTWAADCQRPFVRFAEHEIQIFADGQTYPITGVTYDGSSLVVAYTTGNGPIEETFAAQGENLSLVGGAYDGVDVPAAEATPMQRCE
ncbi:MAG: hypothetical protein J0L52_07650 [Caulobacterales bacterium]|nr:hypothetical protein [Caulobacterales bacterium]